MPLYRLSRTTRWTYQTRLIKVSTSNSYSKRDYYTKPRLITLRPLIRRPLIVMRVQQPFISDNYGHIISLISNHTWAKKKSSLVSWSFIMQLRGDLDRIVGVCHFFPYFIFYLWHICSVESIVSVRTFCFLTLKIKFIVTKR